MTPLPTPLHPERASTLIMVVFVIAILAVLLGAAFDYTTNTAILSSRSQDLTAEQGLAEGVLEGAFVVWKNYMAYYQNTPSMGTYTKTADFTPKLAPLVAGFNSTLANSPYVVTSVTINAVDRANNLLASGHTDTSWTSSPPTTPGWVGKGYVYQAQATVSKALNKASGTRDATRSFTVSRYFQTTDCSLFQAMMFFQNDLELNPGSNMTIFGLVATNSNLYLSAHKGVALTFNDSVSFHGDSKNAIPAINHPLNAIYDTSGNDKDGNPIYTGYFEGVTQTLYNREFKSANWDTFDNPIYATLKSTQLSGPVGALNPLGTSSDLPIDATNANATGTHEIIERPVPTSKTNPNPKAGTTDSPDYMAHRLYNNAGLRIFINRNSSSPVTVYTPMSTTDPENNVAALPTLTAAIASTITPAPAISTFWDAREVGAINVSTVDMSKLTPILNAYTGYNGNVVYITDVTNMDGNGETADGDAIRIKKGGVLPDAGLTLVSDGAVYVQGDYNTGTTYKADSANGAINPVVQPDSDANGTSANYTVGTYVAKPASIVGDAVMILSNSWLDSNSNGTLAARKGTGTTFNAALVTGQTLTDNTSTSATSASGGAHNLPRFLEDWSGKVCAYHGSMVELYASKHFTGDWYTSPIYGAPSRYWYFEKSYLNTPPPGNLRSTTYVRGRWVRDTPL